MVTKIDWCDLVLNLWWGCLNKCEFCYARRDAKRRAERLGYLRGYDTGLISKMKNFYPVLFPDWKDIMQRTLKVKVPKFVFMDSMSDIYYWTNLKEIIGELKKYPQHVYLFLTKRLAVYKQMEFPANCLRGFSFTTEGFLEDWEVEYISQGNIDFISFEPLHNNGNAKLEYDDLIKKVKWIIIGIQSPVSESTKPDFNNIQDLIHSASKVGENGIPVFIKDNVYKGFPDMLNKTSEYPHCIDGNGNNFVRR